MSVSLVCDITFTWFVCNNVFNNLSYSMGSDFWVFSGEQKSKSPVNVVAMSYVSLTYFIHDRQLPNCTHVLSSIETPIAIGAIWRHVWWLCLYLLCKSVLCQRHHTLYNSLQTAAIICKPSLNAEGYILSTECCIFCWPCISLRIVVNNQFDALFHVFIYFISLHVSSITVLIIRRSNFHLVWLVCVSDCLACLTCKLFITNNST